MHYVEAGSGDPILLIHGQPTWSYLWRNVIPHLENNGRVIAVDLIGFGKSDRPDIGYTTADHVKYLEGFIAELGLKNITLVIHDWGSFLGFHYATRHEGNVKGIAFMEAILRPIEQMNPLFDRFRSEETGWDLLVTQNMFIETLMPAMIVRKLSEDEMNAYREPFADPAGRRPVYMFPNELPIAGQPPESSAMQMAYIEKLKTSPIPKLLLHATPGAIGSGDTIEWIKQNLPNLETVSIGPGRHYVQEDQPDAIGQAISRWMSENGL